MADRMKLKIIEVKPPRQVGQAEVLEFLAQNGDAKTLRYSVWHKSLYEYIKKDSVIDVDVEIKVSEKTDPEGNHYVSRKVVQFYGAKGEALVKKQVRTYGKSPEEVRAERASIEAMCAVKVITELELGGKVTSPQLIGLRDAWLKRVLGGQRGDSYE
jgi:hypothetical protein